MGGGVIIPISNRPPHMNILIFLRNGNLNAKRAKMISMSIESVKYHSVKIQVRLFAPHTYAKAFI